MNRDNRNRYRRPGATPRFKASKRLSRSILAETEGKVRVDRVDITAGRHNKVPGVLVITENGGVGVVYVGPSVEGGDKEYVKVLTGDVDRRKPSFV